MNSCGAASNGLTEQDVPGASLNGRDPSTLKIPELKRWLLCRSASTRGKKADLVLRVRSYIKNGWASKIINPDQPSDIAGQSSAAAANVSEATTNVTSQSSKVPSVTSITNWKDVKVAFGSADEVPSFSHGQMVTYFVLRTVDDGLPAGDFKGMNAHAKRLFDCGHVQNVDVGSSDTHLCIRANCLPEMKKNKVYKIFLSLKKETCDVDTAVCGCTAGKGPKASCKHVGALCYAFAEFCSSGQLPGFLTCTQKLQEWNRPRPRKVEVIPVLELGHRKQVITKKEAARPVPSQYDPRPLSMRSPDPLATEKLRVDLVTMNTCCALTHLLTPPIEVALHDHDYISNADNCRIETAGTLASTDTVIPVELLLQTDLTSPCVEKCKLNVTPAERKKIEESTRHQSHSLDWHVARARRITGSKCGKILCQKERTEALLKAVLYSKPMDPGRLPAPIKWGIENEARACTAYTTYRRKSGHGNLQTSPCGFIVHPSQGWLGASPDAFVTDPSSVFHTGIAEFKCPYSKKDMLPSEACEDTSFYCTMIDNKLRLKRHHQYYHQVQLQLFVGMDLYHWCDFCIYTPKGIAVERIWLDTDWCNLYIPELESYFDAYMLPEIVSPTCKPSYIL